MSSRKRTILECKICKRATMGSYFFLLFFVTIAKGFQPYHHVVHIRKLGCSKRVPVLSRRLTTEPTEKNEENKPLMTVLNELGQSFKQRAQKASQQASEADKISTRYLRRFQACCCYMLFILYRGYRGFFVLLPTLFRSVYSKLMEAGLEIEKDVDAPNGNEQNLSSSSPATDWTTRITVFILTSIVTAGYVLGGFLRVLTKFVRTIATSSVEKSFDAAAKEFESHEERLRRKSKEKESP